MSDVQRLLRYSVGVQRVSDANVSGIVAENPEVSLDELRTRACAKHHLDPATHFFFFDGTCVDHSRPAQLVEQEIGQKAVLQLARGCLRLRFARGTLPDRLVFVDLRGSRPVTDLLNELTTACGMYTTPTTFVHKDRPLARNAAGSLADHEIRLNDIILVVRSSTTVVLVDKSAEETTPTDGEETTTIHLSFYGLEATITVPANATIELLKAAAAEHINQQQTQFGNVSVEELRVVQCNVNFSNTSSIKELKPFPIEIMRQWSASHLHNPACFVAGGSIPVNCTYCASAGSVARLRPRCHTCLGENVMMDKSLSTWSDLVGSTATCHHCNQKVSNFLL